MAEWGYGFSFRNVHKTICWYLHFHKTYGHQYWIAGIPRKVVSCKYIYIYIHTMNRKNEIGNCSNCTKLTLSTKRTSGLLVRPVRVFERNSVIVSWNHPQINFVTFYSYFKESLSDEYFTLHMHVQRIYITYMIYVKLYMYI